MAHEIQVPEHTSTVIEVIRKRNCVMVYEDSWLIYGRDFFHKVEDADRFAALLAKFTPIELIHFIENEA